VTVFTDFRIDTRPYSGYADPSLPIATYIAQGSTVGDASGGQMNIAFIFQDGDAPRTTEMYNLEQLAMDTSINAAALGTMRLLRMDSLSTNRPAFGQSWSLLLPASQGSSENALGIGALALPLWFGAPNVDEGDALVRFIFSNVDLELYLVTIQGYIWGPRSVMAPGGPQRPVGSLFGK